MLSLRDSDGTVALAHLARGEPEGKEESGLSARLFVKVPNRPSEGRREAPKYTHHHERPGAGWDVGGVTCPCPGVALLCTHLRCTLPFLSLLSLHSTFLFLSAWWR